MIIIYVKLQHSLKIYSEPLKLVFVIEKLSYFVLVFVSLKINLIPDQCYINEHIKIVHS